MKTIVVLGMHRSATSLISKSLHKEIYMGENFAYPPGNSLGTFEEKKFQHLNEEILKMAGGSWNNPPSEKDILATAPRVNDRIKELIENSMRVAKKRGYNIWGWKDPRNCLTIKLYLPFLENPHFNLQFREPAKVAESLVKRDKMDYNDAFILATVYNKRLMKFINEWLNNEYYVYSSSMERD
jgi:hypothetical protein